MVWAAALSSCPHCAARPICRCKPSSPPRWRSLRWCRRAVWSPRPPQVGDTLESLGARKITHYTDYVRALRDICPSACIDSPVEATWQDEAGAFYRGQVVIQRPPASTCALSIAWFLFNLVDVIDVAGQVSDDPRLTLPHPRARERAFVLIPWLEVDPVAELPRVGPVRRELERIGAAGVRRVAGPLR